MDPSADCWRQKTCLLKAHVGKLCDLQVPADLKSEFRRGDSVQGMRVEAAGLARLP